MVKTVLLTIYGHRYADKLEEIYSSDLEFRKLRTSNDVHAGKAY